MSARSLMIMGTASDAGKSVIVTALCRLFASVGIRVTPFKAQNMSNNAAVCGGGEIGRAQAVQAEACGLEPAVDMNPVLLKPESEGGCQVVIQGRARFRMAFGAFDHYREQAWPEIVSSYRRLAEKFDLIIIEGAGGAAEINLRDRDIVNWPVAELADAPVLIVADIEKGGALASLVGTVALLSPSERRRVKGLIINKFRGDPTLLYDARQIIEERTGVPVLGVLPHAGNLEVPQEDSASLKMSAKHSTDRPILIGVVAFPRIANYTDFEPLIREPDVSVQYIEDPQQINTLDVLCLPGTKSTIADLQWLRDCRWDRRIESHLAAGGEIVGICGGYQMLGKGIKDLQHVESEFDSIVGLGLLDIDTSFEGEKITAAASGTHIASGLPISGYEIHCGRISRLGAEPLLMLSASYSADGTHLEGAIGHCGQVWGTSVHGLFDMPQFRRHFLNRIRHRKGLASLDAITSDDASAARNKAYNRLAQLVQKHLDLSAIAAMMDIEPGLLASSG